MRVTTAPARSLGTLAALTLAVGLLGAPASPAAEPPADRVPVASAVPAEALPKAAAGRVATRYPTPRTSGVPRGWEPRQSVSGDVRISKAGAVVEDLRITNGSLLIDAPDVTVRRVEILGGGIDNYAGASCGNGLVIRSTTIRRAPGQITSGDYPAVGVGGYTARRVAIIGLPEGFRVGGKDSCGPVTIVNSFAKVISPDDCGDWHGDALQGYDGPHLTLRNSVLKMRMRDDCGGTAPFFYPYGQGNTSVTIDGLVVAGGGYPFRLGEPGTVSDLNIVRGSWVFGPIDVACSAVDDWDAAIVDLKGGQPVREARRSCNTDGGN